MPEKTKLQFSPVKQNRANAKNLRNIGRCVPIHTLHYAHNRVGQLDERACIRYVTVRIHHIVGNKLPIKIMLALQSMPRAQSYGIMLHDLPA